MARAAQAQGRLRRAWLTALAQRGARLAAAAQFLNAVSYRNVLARGFALVRDGAGAPLRSAAAIGPGARLQIEFSDGRVDAIARPEPPPAPAKTARKSPERGGRAPRDPGQQGSLF